MKAAAVCCGVKLINAQVISVQVCAQVSPAPAKLVNLNRIEYCHLDHIGIQSKRLIDSDTWIDLIHITALE